MEIGDAKKDVGPRIRDRGSLKKGKGGQEKRVGLLKCHAEDVILDIERLVRAFGAQRVVRLI